MLTTRSVTLFYSMYNELQSVRPMTEKALGVLQEITADFEILIIDDGSSDGSEKIADQLAAEHPQVRVIHHGGDKGYGQALRTGFASASKEVLACTDCDEPADLRLLREAVPLLEYCDMVIGYRLICWPSIRRCRRATGCT
jgi:glycosyltransferase involved in cell wall biosynthesis